MGLLSAILSDDDDDDDDDGDDNDDDDDDDDDDGDVFCSLPCPCIRIVGLNWVW